MVPRLSGLEMCGGTGVDSKGIRDGGEGHDECCELQQFSVRK